VTLNAERTQEEKQGIIRWLRPEYQTKSKEKRKTIQTTLDIALTPKADMPVGKIRQGRGGEAPLACGNDRTGPRRPRSGGSNAGRRQSHYG
jgi:hypothetical protein